MSSNSILGKRIEQCRKAEGLTQLQLATELNVQRQIVSYYENGSRKPDIDMLRSLANRFHVSTDYLLGLTDAPTTDKDLRYICDYTGLSEKAVEVMNYYQYHMLAGSPMNEAVSALIEEYDDNTGMDGLLSRIITHPAQPYDYALTREQKEQISDALERVIGYNSILEPSIDVAGMLNAALLDRLQKAVFAFQNYRIHRKSDEVNE